MSRRNSNNQVDVSYVELTNPVVNRYFVQFPGLLEFIGDFA